SHVSMGTPPITVKLLKLAHHDDADNQHEEGEAFDQSGGDDHVGADGALGFRLTGDGFHGRSTDVADATGRARDAEARPDHDAGSADTDAEVARAHGSSLHRFGDRLRQHGHVLKKVKHGKLPPFRATVTVSRESYERDPIEIMCPTLARGFGV